MKEDIFTYNWRKEISSYVHDSIEEDYIILDDPSFFSTFKYPNKLDATLVIICTHGSVQGMLDLKEFNEKAPFMLIVLVNQIITFKKFSKDFSGHFMFMSTPFLENLFTNKRQSSKLYLHSRQNPIVRLNSEEFRLINYFYNLIRDMVRLKDNPQRIEIVSHLTLALYYLQNFMLFENTSKVKKSKNEILVKDFLDDVGVNFKKYREMKFYANKLNLTAKYLSKIIKETSGKSGNEWINEYVVLEAKALLKSTNMTIQQISDELNFSNQSFFGRYFKNHVGLSPKQFRNN